MRDALFVRVTPKTLVKIDEIIKKSSILQKLKDEGYDITRSSLTRFGLLFAITNLDLIKSNPGLLLASHSLHSTENKIRGTAK